MTASPWSRGMMVIMALVAVSAATCVAIALAAPASDVTTAPRTDSPQQADDKSDMTPASEELIAAALKAGEITHEESFLQRASTLYDESRLERHFRNPIEMSSAIGRVRRVTMASSVQAPSTSRPHWESRSVSGTNVRIWIDGAQGDLNPYESMVKRVWSVFDQFFPYPMPDDGAKDSAMNIDSAIDLYFVHSGTVDPRLPECRAEPIDSELCVLGADGGVARPAPPNLGNRSSGFALINIDYPADIILDTIAHELAHVAQCQYALDEMGPMWFKESTATWVAYKVMKQLGEVPSVAYEWLKHSGSSPLFARRPAAPLTEFFETLHMGLVAPWTQYGSWLFFYYASMEMGDGIVRSIWEKAAQTPGADGIKAVNEVMPLDYHFPRFTVRNWNQDPVPKQYKTKDKSFPPGLKPGFIYKIKESGPYTKELNGSTLALAADYYVFEFQNTTRKVTFEKLPTVPNAHVWAIQQIGTEWKEPEDWTGEEYKDFCRDWQDEDLTNLVIIVSNSDIADKLPREPKVRVIADAVGCEFVEGWAKASLRITHENFDVSYVSNKVKLRFKPRASPLQDAGHIQYDLMPTSVTWTAAGYEGDCTISGQIVVNIPRSENQPLDLHPTRLLAYGYLNVVGLDGGDFHSVMVQAMDPQAVFKKSCPGPQVSNHGSPAGSLLHIIFQPNTYEGPTVVFKGKKSIDLAKPEDVFGLLPSGVALPDVVQEALGQTSSSGRSNVYTWEWELRPLTFGQTSGN